MKTKILLLIANLMIFAMPLLANTTESDTIWTRNLLPGDIRGCAFTLTGDSIVAISGEGGGDSLYILETATGNILKRVGIRPWSWEFIHFNTKSWIAITAFPEDGGLYIYDYINDKVINDKFGFLGNSKAITKDDNILYVQNSHSEPGNISIYDIINGKIIDSISSSYGRVHSMALSPNNEYLAIGTGLLRTVNPDPENPEYEEQRIYDKIEVLKVGTWEIVKEFDGPFGTEGKIIEMKFSPDGKYLGVAKLDGTVRLYEMGNFELYRKFVVYGYSDFYGCWKINFSNDSKYLITGLNIPNIASLKFWDIENDSLAFTYNSIAYITLNVLFNNYILISGISNLVLINPKINTKVKESINKSADTTSIYISKIINNIKSIDCNMTIKEFKFFDSLGNKIKFNNIQINNINNILLNVENIQCGIYYLA